MEFLHIILLFNYQHPMELSLDATLLLFSRVVTVLVRDSLYLSIFSCIPEAFERIITKRKSNLLRIIKNNRAIAL